MKREEILTKLVDIIQQNLEVQLPEKVEESHRTFEDLGIDSIMVLQLVVYIEEAFGVAVPEEDVDPDVFKSVGALITFIQELQQSGS
jgi:acyl carrier protein